MQKKKVIVWIVLALFLAALLAALALFWPVIRSAVSVEKLEDGLYAMEYRSDYSLDEFLEGGGASSDLAEAAPPPTWRWRTSSSTGAFTAWWIWTSREALSGAALWP